VKEWLNFLLSPDFNIIRSPKSYNSQVGAPLSVLAINEMHNLGIFEAGISKINEMEQLETIIRPTIGVFTNIGSAHDEGFENLEQKIKEKLQLFKNAKRIIYQKNKDIDFILSSVLPSRVRGLFSWSFSDKTADVFISKTELQDKTILQVQYNEINFKFEILNKDQNSKDQIKKGNKSLV